MMKKIKEVVIPKEDAVFWLDKYGCWHNKNEKFQHRKIIHYFHSSIKKDKNGYHLLQTHRDYREKVYFHYEDTALFVFDILQQGNVILILNTKKRVPLKPKKLFIKDDSLYMHVADEQIKFTEHALIRIAKLIEFEKDNCFIRVRGRRYRIQQG